MGLFDAIANQNNGIINALLQDATNRSNQQNTMMTNQMNYTMNKETNDANERMNEMTNQANLQNARETNANNLLMTQETNAMNERIANQNLAFQQASLDYNKALNQQIFEREDSAQQRAVQDAIKAGVSPLAGMNGAGAGGSVSQIEAMQNDMEYQTGHEESIQMNPSIRQAMQFANYNEIAPKLEMINGLDSILEHFWNISEKEKDRNLQREINESRGTLTQALTNLALNTFGLNKDGSFKEGGTLEKITKDKNKVGDIIGKLKETIIKGPQKNENNGTEEIIDKIEKEAAATQKKPWELLGVGEKEYKTFQKKLEKKQKYENKAEKANKLRLLGRGNTMRAEHYINKAKKVFK